MSSASNLEELDIGEKGVEGDLDVSPLMLKLELEENENNGENGKEF